MKEIESVLDWYGSECSVSIWMLGGKGDMDTARSYLEKYYLPEEEYMQHWKPVQDRIFLNADESLSNLVFRDGYEMMAIKGGCLFLQEDFEQLQRCWLATNTKWLVIVQNTFGKKLGHPPLRFKFPADICWDDLRDGNFISITLLDLDYDEYFVFSESPDWGKYAASDYDMPLDIIGFKPEYSTVFHANMTDSPEDHAVVLDWLPDKYKGLIK